MIELKDIHLFLSEEGWVNTNKESKITFKASMTDDKKDIKVLEFSYTKHGIIESGKLTYPLIVDIKERYISYDVNATLLDIIASIIDNMDPIDIEIISKDYNLLFPNSDIDNISNKQMVCDVFLSEMLVYLSFMKMMYDDMLWDLLPCSFDPPLKSMSENILTSNSIEYMSKALSGIISMTIGELTSMCEIITKFSNSWSFEFIQGPKVDTLSMMNDITSATFQNIMSKISTKDADLRHKISTLERTIAKLECNITKLQQDTQLVLEENKELHIELEELRISSSKLMSRMDNTLEYMLTTDRTNSASEKHPINHKYCSNH